MDRRSKIEDWQKKTVFFSGNLQYSIFDPEIFKNLRIEDRRLKIPGQLFSDSLQSSIFDPEIFIFLNRWIEDWRFPENLFGQSSMFDPEIFFFKKIVGSKIEDWRLRITRKLFRTVFNFRSPIQRIHAVWGLRRCHFFVSSVCTKKKIKKIEQM